jgi:hypothetical protein
MTQKKIFNRDWVDIDNMQHKRLIEEIVAPFDGTDYGCDYIGDGKYKMHPSGDIVDYTERCRRLLK